MKNLNETTEECTPRKRFKSNEDDFSMYDATPSHPQVEFVEKVTQKRYNNMLRLYSYVWFYFQIL